DGNFYALDIESGYMHWVFKSGASINSVPCADEERVYFGSQDGKAYAVDRKEGIEAWSFDTGRPVNSTFQRYKDLVLFTSDGGASFFVDLQGKLVDKIPNPVWYYYSYHVVDDIIYLAPGPLHQPHSFGPYDTRTKKYLWLLDTYEFQATWYSFPAVKDNLVHFSTCGYTGFGWILGYYAYDRKTGKRVWGYEDMSRWGPTYKPDLEGLFLRNLTLLDFMAPSLWKNLAIYTGGDAVVRAFHAQRGTLVWEKEFKSPISSAPLVAGDRLYFGLIGDPHNPDPKERNPSLVCLSARDGRLLWRMEVEGALLSAPVVAGKWLMFGTDKSLFYILEEVF
ncbi:MAG: PQQ-binding-like beta-propeller repeat protein, partial [Spirochaetales bacterium]